MEIALLVLLVLAIPVAAIAGFVMALQLRTRMGLLEQRLAHAEARLAGWSPDLGAAASSDVAPDLPEESAPVAASVTAEEPPQADDAQVPEEPAPQPQAPPSPAPPAGPGLEERLGTRWPVWVGGIALALGGAYLVRYSIDQGLLGPAARIVIGAFFAVALLVAGEALRRREATFAVPGLSSAHIPGVITAAGASTAFAVAYAAYALYGFIGAGPALAILGLIALATMLAASLHGPALAGLGLIGALAAPLLIDGDAPRLWPLVLYLAFVAFSAYAVSRLRLWRWLAASAAAGAILWAPLLLAAGNDPYAPMAHILVQIALAGLFLVADPHRATPDAAARPDRLATAVLLSFALVAVAATQDWNIALARPLFAMACIAALVALAVRFAPAAAGAVGAVVVSTGTLMGWPVAYQSASELSAIVPGPLSPAPLPEALGTFVTFAAASAAAVAAPALWRLSRGRSLPLSTAAWLAGAASAGPLLILVAAYWQITDAFSATSAARDLPFALGAALLGVAYLVAAAWLRRLDGTDESVDAVRLALGASASAAVAALAAGLVFLLDKGMLTVALALAALGTAYVAERLRLDVLRYAVAALGIVVLGRLVWDPSIAGGDPGATPIFNWLLWGYGVPSLAFYFAGRLLERSGGRGRVVRFAESLAIVFAAFLVVFQIRHALHHGDPLAATSDHLEVGLLASSALVFAILMVSVDARRPDPVSRIASLAFGAVSLVLSGVGLCFVVNPFLTGEAVLGGAVFNSLIGAYLVPALLAAVLALAARGVRPNWYVLAAAALALVLFSGWTMLALRRLFQGPYIGLLHPIGQGEWWSYSVALIAIGVCLLAVGLWRDFRLARLVSAFYILAAVLKVFVLDLANLEGATRAFSLIGLGIALVGIGMAYQRLFVARVRTTLNPGT